MIPGDSAILKHLLSWESIYTIVKWYVEVYGPVDLIVPEYIDPSPQEKTYDISELEGRLKVLEEMLRQALNPEPIEPGQKETTTIPVDIPYVPEQPGFTTIRTLTYKGQTLDIPYFLRDASCYHSASTNPKRSSFVSERSNKHAS